MSTSLSSTGTSRPAGGATVETPSKPAGGASVETQYFTTEQEYETQFLGFAPKSLCDGLYNAVSDYTWEYFQASQQYIKSQFQKTLKDGELQKASDVILSTLNKAIDRAFDKFETYILTNIMCLPQNLVLPEDVVHHQYHDWTATQQEALNDDIKNLKARIKAMKFLNASLRQELQHVDLVQKEYNKFMDNLHLMERKIRETGVTDVHESLLFSVEKCDSVIETLQEIQEVDRTKHKRARLMTYMSELSKKCVLDSEEENTDPET